jgi:hypothetical protein
MFEKLAGGVAGDGGLGGTLGTNGSGLFCS